MDKVIVVLVICGIVIVIISYIVKPKKDTSGNGTSKPTKTGAELEQEINNKNTELSDGQFSLSAAGVDSDLCPATIALANEIYNLLLDYNKHPKKSPAMYKKLKEDFEEARKYLDSWCTDYDPKPLPVE